MTPSRVSERVVGRRLTLIQDLLRQIRSLPLGTREAFLADSRNVGAAESYLRRSLEALLDVGRHILAKGYGQAIGEYKEIAQELRNHLVLTDDEAKVLRVMAGYRNRLVHFYQEVSADELYEICARESSDIERIADGFRRWMKQHPDKVEQA